MNTKGNTALDAQLRISAISHTLPLNPGLRQLGLRLAARLGRDSLFKNSFFLMLASAGSALLGLLFWVVVARFYAPVDLGLASALISAISLLNLFSNLGFHAGLIRFLPDEKDKAGMINSSVTLAGLLSALIAAVFVAGLPLWSPSLAFLRQSFPLLVAFVVFAAISPILYQHRSAFVSFNSGEYFFIEQMVYMGLKIVLVVVLVALGAAGIFASWGLSLLLALASGALLLRKAQPGYAPVPSLKRPLIGRMLHFSLGNYLAEGVGNAPPFLLPLLIIGKLGAEANAYYYIAYSMSSALLMVPVAVSLSLFAEGASQPEKLRANIKHSARLMASILIPAVVLFLLFGDKLLLLFGGAYSHNAIDVFRLLSVASLFTAVNYLYIGVQQARTRVKSVIVISSAAAILSLAGCYLLMGWFGLPGLGWGWLAGQGAVTAAIGLKLAWGKISGGKSDASKFSERV